jgi:hypothetical protein
MKNAAAGDGVVDRVLKIKLADRSKYVEMAAKYHKLWADLNVAIVPTDELLGKLDAGRLRIAQLARVPVRKSKP